MADQVTVLKEGRVVETGACSAILSRPREAYTQRLIGSVPPLIPRVARKPSAPLLHAASLSKSWRTPSSFLRRAGTTLALDDVSISVGEGETIAVVGESGSGKSTLARVLARLTPCDSGQARLEGVADDYMLLAPGALRPLRKAVQMIFQDPYASLNPRHTVGSSIAMGPIAMGTAPREAMRQARELLARVSVDPKAADHYPNEFSGGQRQRIVIARALAMQARLLIADEPVSSLDVSVQAEILDLLDEIQLRDRLGMIFITHDLRVASRMADRILVMRKGRVVESGSATEILADAQQPYTRELLAAIPKLTPAERAAAPILQ